MGLSLSDGDEESFTASINTTPLVDVMLVLLIIFLITVPVVIHTVPVALPHETDQPTVTKPRPVVIAVDKLGNIYWNDAAMADANALVDRLKARAAESPPPDIQIRADEDVRYEFVGRVVRACEEAGIARIAFIVEPAPGAGRPAE